MKRASILLCMLVFLAALPLKAAAAPLTDGFWDSQNGDGYFGNLANTVPCCLQNSFDYGGAVNATGALGFYTDGSFLYVMFTQPLAVVDNSYGPGSVGWDAKTHKFGDLVGSDHAELFIKNGSGTTIYDAKIDYISDDGTKTNNYVSLGDQGGDGKIVTDGRSAALKALGSPLVGAATSIQWDLDHSCYSKNAAKYLDLTTNGDGDSPNTGVAKQPVVSPAPGNNNDGYGTITMDPCPLGQTSDMPAGYTTNVNWLFHVVYELKFDLTKLGINPVTDMDVFVVHDSPFKAAAGAAPCDDCDVTITATPEPASLVLLGSGILGLGSALRRRRQNKK